MPPVAAQAGEIKVSDDSANPVIALRIVGVDTESILANAQALDSDSYRIQKVRQLLCESLRLDTSQSWVPQLYEMTWQGSRRSCEILFRNVREMNPEEFRNTEGLWRIVIDWPFDEPPFKPVDDVAQIQKFRAREELVDTIVWLPWFFTDATKRDLGRLVLLDQVLSGNRLAEYGSHLSQTDRDQARGLMANQRDQMRTRIRNCLLAAYGISRTDTGAVDDGHDPEGHVISLNPALSPRPPVAADIGEAVEDVFGQALAARFPRSSGVRDRGQTPGPAARPGGGRASGGQRRRASGGGSTGAQRSAADRRAAPARRDGRDALQARTEMAGRAGTQARSARRRDAERARAAGVDRGTGTTRSPP